MEWKFGSQNLFPSICKIQVELGRTNKRFGTYVRNRVERYRSCEILEKGTAAPPCVSPEKTTGAVAPASV